MTTSAVLEAGQRVQFRGLRWIVADSGSDQTLTLIGDDRLNRDRRIQVLRDFEPVEPAEVPPLEIRIGEPGWSQAEWQALHDAYRLTLAHGWGFMGGVSWGRLVVEPYQLVPLRKLEHLTDARLLIADDTGLGKTAEAGIILTRLLQRRRADRVLVLSKADPDPDRWVGELQEKFGLDFRAIADGADYARLRRRVPAHLNVFASEPRLVVSMSWAAQKHVVDELAKVPRWDVVILDEAHHFADRGSPNKRLATLGRLVAERSDALLLLTATPHDGKPESFSSLIELIDPFAVSDRRHLEPEVVRPLMVRRLKPWVVRADGTRFARRVISPIAVDAADDDLRTPAERSLARALRGYAAQLRTAARRFAQSDERQAAFATGFLDSLLRKRLSSSIPALAETLETVLRNFASPTPEPVETEDLERGQAAVGLPAELPDGRDHRKLVEELLRRARAIPPADGAKTRALVRLLRRIVREQGEKAVVFTEYYDTLDHLAETLRAEGYRDEEVLTFHGGTRNREDVIERFREDPGALVLLATDAASEAVNLQRSCHHLVHIEVPWNPNRYEQRNGRIDRYGQTQTPQIMLLVARRTAEDRAAEIVLLKLEQIAYDVGSVANVAPLEAAQTLEEFLGRGFEADHGSGETGELGERAGRELEARLEEEHAAAGGPVDELVRGERFDEALLAEVQADLDAADAAAPGSDAVRGFLDLFLKRDGPHYGVEESGEPGIVTVDLPARHRDLVGGTRIARGTFDRAVAVREAELSQERRAVFLSPGNPLVAAALREARGWAHRPDFASRVGYRVVSPEDEGVILTYAVRLLDGRGETLEERFEAVRLGRSGALVASGAEADAALRSLGRLGTGLSEVGRATLEALRSRWGDLQAAGMAAAGRRADQRREALRTAQAELARSAQDRLDAWRRAREEQITASFGGEEAQLGLLAPSDPVRRMAQGRRDAERGRVASRARERRAELDALPRVRVEAIESIGALILVAE